MQIAFYISGHGYGHLTRALEVARSLRAITTDIGIHVRAPFLLGQVEDSLGFAPDTFQSTRLDIGLVQLDSLRADLPASADKLAYYYGSEGDRIIDEEAGWLTGASIDAALIDIPPRAFDACDRAGIPAFGLTNFSWDWIWRDLAEEEPRLAHFADLAEKSYAGCRLLFKTVMASGLDAFPVQTDVPLVARISRRDPEETRRLLGLENEKPVVLLSFGGEGLRNARPPDAELHRRYTFIATEPMPDPGPPFKYISDSLVRSLDLRYCDLIRMVDIAMSKPGYSTIAECVANRSALVFSDRSRFAEYPVIIDYIREVLPSEHIQMEELLAGKWSRPLNKLAAHSPFEFKRVRTDGADVVAKRLICEVERIRSGQQKR